MGDINMVKYSNISVLLTHKFMDAVKNDTDFDLVFDGEVYETIKAKDLWNKIISSAHSSAEPGLLFWDTMTDYHNAEYCSPLVSTNPCAEQPLPDGGCCNLGAVNLERFVDSNQNCGGQIYRAPPKSYKKKIDKSLKENKIQIKFSQDLEKPQFSRSFASNA